MRIMQKKLMSYVTYDISLTYNIKIMKTAFKAL